MFNKILVPVDIDYPNTAREVYRRAARIAQMSNGEVKLISIMPGFGMPIVASYISEEIKKEARDRLTKAIETFIQENCDTPVTYKIATGKHWEIVLKEADNWGADLIVVYHNRHRAVNEMFSSACSERVTDNANCSVLRLRNIRIEKVPE